MSQFIPEQEATTKVYFRYSEEERRSYGANWPYPSGFREFARPSALLVGAVAWATNLLLAPCRISQTPRNAVAGILGDRFLR